MTHKYIKDPVIWFQYLCWCIQFWMNCHRPYYPDWFRMLVSKHWPNAHERWSLTQDQIEFWNKIAVDYPITYKPLPWFIGPAAIGPFVNPWNKVSDFFRQFTGGRSHRCEFTDPEHGALYGHNEGPFMDELFNQFIERISNE